MMGSTALDSLASFPALSCGGRSDWAGSIKMSSRVTGRRFEAVVLLVLSLRTLHCRLCTDISLTDESLHDGILYMPDLMGDLREETCLELVQPIIMEINGLC